MTRTISRLIVLAAATAFLATGCITSGDLSNSSKWSSKASSSPFTSSSKSSGGDEEDAAYRRDVTSLTFAYLEAGEAGGDLLRDLTRVAEQHGITDWEASPVTFVAIGAGLRQGGIDAGSVDAFAQRHFGGNPEILGLLLEGYHS
jgi:hypothetical protein